MCNMWNFVHCIRLLCDTVSPNELYETSKENPGSSSNALSGRFSLFLLYQFGSVDVEWLPLERDVVEFYHRYISLMFVAALDRNYPVCIQMAQLMSWESCAHCLLLPCV